jgi:hypothetical protein
VSFFSNRRAQALHSAGVERSETGNEDGPGRLFFDATQCRVEPSERRHKEVPAGQISQGWRHGGASDRYAVHAGSGTVMKVLCLIGTAMLLLAGLWGCSAQQKELRRQTSPNQKLVAVLMESILKDTAGSVREDIYVNDQGVPLNLDKPVFSAVGCDHLSFEWVNDYTLQIHYETTCVINQFTNRWSRPSDVAVGRPNPIEIVLVRG